MAHQPPAALKFDQLPLCIVERIVGLLEAKDQGRAACSMRLCRQAVAPRAPALYHFTSRGDVGAVARLLQVPAVRAAVDVRHGHCRTTALYSAVEHGRPALVDALLAGGADPSRPVGTGETPLLRTFLRYSPRIDIAKQLLAAGADVSASNSSGETVLLLACRSGDHESVKILLQKGANATIAAGDGCTPLMAAAESFSCAILESIMEAGVDVLAVDNDGESALMKACQEYNLESVEALLAAGAQVNNASKDGRTPLLMACNLAPPKILTRRLKAGADIHATTMSGKTALMLAAENHYHCFLDGIDILVEAGIDIHAVDEEGRSAACIAVEFESHHLLDKLLAAGVMPRPGAYYRALISAYDQGEDEKVEELVAAGAAVDLKDVKKWAVLIPPAAEGNLEEINRLLEEGAAVDIKIPDLKLEELQERSNWGGYTSVVSYGKTALLFAAETGSVPIVSRLLEASADVNGRSVDGLSALMLAAMHGHIGVVRRLLQNLPAPALEAVSGDFHNEPCLTALEFAWKRGHSSIVQALLQAGAKLPKWREPPDHRYY